VKSSLSRFLPKLFSVFSRSREQTPQAPPSLSGPSLAHRPARNGDQADESESNPAVVGLRDIIHSGWFDTETGEICKGVPICPGNVVVDVGCGDGGAIKFCAGRGASVIFTDIDEKKVRKLELELREIASGSVQGIVGTGEDIDLADAVADRIISTEVLEHVDDPQKVMAEMYRIGKPGAMYLLTVPHEIGEEMMTIAAPRQYFEKPNHVRIFRQDEFQRLVEGCGLDTIKIETFGGFWSIFFTIFWPTGSDFTPPHHPALSSWSRTWQAVLDHENGHAIKAALDRAIPSKQFILARKP